MRPYIIRQGDHLDSIAHSAGFDADEVWSHPRNNDLRARRPDRTLLCPGDVLFVPDRALARRSVSLGGANPYATSVPAVRLALRLQLDDKTLADTPWRATGPAFEAEGKSTSDGVIELDVPITAREIVVNLPEQRMEWVVLVGGLDPLEESSGMRERLRNLGFLPRDGDDEGDELRAAIEAFQRSRGIEPRGEADETTRAALREAHGR